MTQGKKKSAKIKERGDRARDGEIGQIAGIAKISKPCILEKDKKKVSERLPIHGIFCTL